jgi:hypothetical protein
MKTAFAFWSLCLCLIFNSPFVWSQENTCASVYRDSLANITFKEQQQLGYAVAYSKYCNANGSINRNSIGASISSALTEIPGSGSFTGSSDEERMSNFCKEGSSQSGYASYEIDFNRRILIDAQQNFNECRKIEGGSVTITHKSKPQFITIQVSSHSQSPRVELTGFQYKPNVVECTSAELASADPRQSLPPDPPRITLEHGFTISCNRISQTQVEGKDYYPDVQMILSVKVNGIPLIYTVDAPADTHLGPAFASEYQRSLDDLNAQNKSLAKQYETVTHALDLARDQLAKTSIVRAEYFYIGESHAPGWSEHAFHVACPNVPKATDETNNAGMAGFAKSFCGDDSTAYLFPGPGNRDPSGNRCGYHYRIVACLKK